MIYSEPRPCLECDEIFTPTPRKRGGTIKQLCSKQCSRKRAERNRNPEKRRASIRKYENKPESRLKKQQRTRKNTLWKYGLTETDLVIELQRQQFRCYGCLKTLDIASARVDHCHKTGRNRGVLCNSCNWTIGHAKDDPAILRRLMAYLERDRTKRLVYVAGALKNPRIPEIGNILRQAGYDAMDEWWTPGEHADANWQKYEQLRGRSYAEALRGRSATNTFLFDKSYIDISDFFVLVMPAGKSGMLELGYASGLGKPSLLLLDDQEPDRYDIMPNAAYKIVGDTNALLHELEILNVTPNDLVRQVSNSYNRICASCLQPLAGCGCACL